MKRHLKILDELGLAKQAKLTGAEIDAYKKMKNNNEQLPDDIVFNNYGEYRIEPNEDVTQEEIYEILLYNIFKNTKIIKGCVIFFVVLAVIAILVGLIIGFNLSSTASSIYRYY